MQQLFDLRRGEVLAGAAIQIGGSACGMLAEGAARDLRPEAFLMRLGDASLPFWGIGAGLAATTFFSDFAIPEGKHSHEGWRAQRVIATSYTLTEL